VNLPDTEKVKILNNSGIQFALEGDMTGSMNCFALALEIEPDNAVVLTNLGGALNNAGRHEEALGILQRSLKVDPISVMANLNRGLAFSGVQQYQDAIDCFDTVLSLHDGHPYALYNRGLAKLAIGDYLGGFIDHHAGLSLPGMRKRLFEWLAGIDQWDGREAQDKTLIIVAEQGFGDSIMFMRYLPQVIARVGKVVLGLHDALNMLYKIPGVTILTHGETIPPIDLQCSLLSLPYLLGIGEKPDEPRN
jgi:tetratricopeptide (TPR) repeat protein